MRAILSLIPILIGAAACAPVDPVRQAEIADARASAIAKAVAGRTPGKPIDCLDQRSIRSTRIIDGAAVIYETLGRDGLYVNRMGGVCPALMQQRVLVTDTPTGRICRGDTVRVIDLPGPGTFGICILGPFEAYAKPR